MSRHLLAGVFVVGIVAAAFLVMGVPNDPEDPAPAPRPAAESRAPARTERPAPTPESEAHLAAAQARKERMQQPDTRLYGGLGSAWSALRYQLSSVRTPEADAFDDRIGELVAALQDARRSPDRADLADLLARSGALYEELRASPLAEGVIDAQLDRIERLTADFAAERAGGGRPVSVDQLPDVATGPAPERAVP